MTIKLYEFLCEVNSSLLLFIICLTLILLHFRSKSSSFDWTSFAKLPGPHYLPVLGNFLQIYGGPSIYLSSMLKLTQTYGPLMRFYMGNSPYIVLTDTEGFKAILNSTTHSFKGNDYNFLKPWLGNGLITSNGQLWKKHRKLLSPTFYFESMTHHRFIIEHHSECLVEKLKHYSFDHDVDLAKMISLCALDIICETALGSKINAQNNENSLYVKSVMSMLTLTNVRLMNPLYKIDWIFKFTNYYTEYCESLRIIKNKTQEIVSSRRTLGFEKEQEKNFLHILLTSLRNDDEVFDEVNSFMFAGHDTTSFSTLFTLYLLASHPKAQELLRRELDTSSDVSSSNYLEMCIKESLRLFPIIPIISRELCEDVVIKGYKIPKGTGIILFNYLLHRDSSVFERPNEFLPERFMEMPPAFSYVPFSAGSRNCIGQKFAMMELKILIGKIIQNFQLSTSLEFKNLVLSPELVLRPLEQIPFFLTPIYNSAI